MGNKGLFISLEGIDGSGKSTQAKLLYETLKGKGFEVVLTREPGGTKEAEDIRNLLIHSQNNWCNETEILLLNAARAEHINKLIKPSLEKGQIVICDRFIDSTLVYQAFAQNKDPKIILNLHNLLFGDFMPDITFILNLNFSEMKKRIKERNNQKFDYFENKDDSYLESIASSYKKCTELFKDRCICIDASLEINFIHEQMMEVIFNKLKG